MRNFIKTVVDRLLQVQTTVFKSYSTTIYVTHIEPEIVLLNKLSIVLLNKLYIMLRVAMVSGVIS